MLRRRKGNSVVVTGANGDAPAGLLAGRDRELALIADRLTGPEAGTAILVRGPAGIGKTALIDEAVRQAGAAAERAGAAGDHDLHVDLLWLVASRAWWVDPGPEARQLLIEASRRLGDANAEDPRVFAIHAYADPVGHAQGVLARLSREAGERLDTDAARFFGPAALVVGAFDLGNDFLRAAAVRDCRADQAGRAAGSRRDPAGSRLAPPPRWPAGPAGPAGHARYADGTRSLPPYPACGSDRPDRYCRRRHCQVQVGRHDESPRPAHGNAP